MEFTSDGATKYDARIKRKKGKLNFEDINQFKFIIAKV